MNWPLYKSFHARGLNQKKLAAATGIHRTVLARILTNEPGRGRETRSKLFPHLLPAEIEILGWTAEYQDWLQCSTDSTRNIVPVTASRPMGGGQ